MKKITLITGDAGHTLSYTWYALLAAGYEVIGLDNLCNSVVEVVWRLGKLARTQLYSVGAQESGLIGEDPKGISNNLMPFVAQGAVGELERLRILGGDYPTHDETGVRDYIHVMDLPQGHVLALSRLFSSCTSLTANLCTCRVYSVLDVIRSCEKASGRVISHEIVVRPPRDIAACYADPTLVAQVLDWRATRGIDEMCVDSWRWQQMRPNGCLHA